MKYIYYASHICTVQNSTRWHYWKYATISVLDILSILLLVGEVGVMIFFLQTIILKFESCQLISCKYLSLSTLPVKYIVHRLI